jgi:hypothetical protein
MTDTAAPVSLRGEGRVYWNVDKVPYGKPWPSGLPDYSGHLQIAGVRFRVEGWRTENDAGRHVRLVVSSEPITAGQWPQR